MKNKKGKKLVVLGAMAALLTLIGVSGSQTYAKYVESKEVVGQTATVAKWGFVQNVNVTNLFGTQYVEETDNVSVVNEATGATHISVKKVTSDGDIVAPGTKGSMSITIEGMAEVDFTLAFSDPEIYDIVLCDGSGVNYSPLVWTLTGKINDVDLANPVDDLTGKTITSLAGCLEQFVDASYHFEAGTELDVEINLSWAWAFEGQNDEYDTILGILASKNTNAKFEHKYSDLLTKYKPGEENYTSLKVGFESFDMTLTQVQADEQP